ncbi:McrC family protein [Rheinheimera sp.]
MQIKIIREYEHLHEAEFETPGDDELYSSCFKRLRDLTTDHEVISKAFTAGKVKGRGFSIRATSYVGIVQVSESTQIEILPKLDLGENDDNARDILLKMLAAVYQLQLDPLALPAVLEHEKVTLLECLVSPFLTEVEKLLRIGLRAQYLRVQENEPFLRGKLLIADNMRLNNINHARFYCEYDIFSQNRPENRLLHSTLEMLHRYCRLASNKQRCYRLLQEFAHIPRSQDARTDLDAWDNSHDNRHYKTLFGWCHMLLGLNPSLKTGKTLHFSLLFPMEKLFECYVTHILQKKLAGNKQHWQLYDQDKHRFGKWLANDTSTEKDDAFALIPDMLIKTQAQTQLLLDAKWKKVQTSQSGYNISQADLYQMFTYVHYFQPQSRLAFLIYPKTGNFKAAIGLELTNKRHDTYTVYAVPFDTQQDEFCGLEQIETTPEYKPLLDCISGANS